MALMASPVRLHLLAISGSLRAASSNTAVLRALAQLCAGEMSISLEEGVGRLPHFNPDLDRDSPPAEVQAFRERVRRSDGILISTPEYAHGVPGSLKNALDWLVSGVEIVGKPVAIINPRSGATWAATSLRETLTVMTARLIPEASISLPLETNRIDTASLLANADLAGLLRSALDAFAEAVQVGQNERTAVDKIEPNFPPEGRAEMDRPSG